MPVKEIRRIDQTTLLGIWFISESWEELLAQACLSADEKAMFGSFKNDTRKKQWLACRLLTREMLGEDFMLVYDADGKPHIREPWHYISVSHSKDMAAVMVSKHKTLGIDIELIGPRIEKVVEKFLSKDEIAAVGFVNRLNKLYVYWSAKEALYKLDGKGAPAFDQQILIGAFEYHTSGSVSGKILRPDAVKEFKVHYEETGGYMLAYATE